MASVKKAFALFPMMAEIAVPLDKAIRKYLKTDAYPFNYRNWEETQDKQAAMKAYVLGTRTLTCTVGDGDIIIDCWPSRDLYPGETRCKSASFPVSDADFDIKIADYLGRLGRCFFSPLWFRSPV